MIFGMLPERPIIQYCDRRRKQNSSHVVEGKYGTNHAKPSAMLLI